MAFATYGSVGELEAAIGSEIGPGDWLELTPERIERFAAATESAATERAATESAATERAATERRMPFSGHGLLTLTLVPHLAGRLREMRNVALTVNYGLNSVRFPAPVSAGDRLRARSSVVSVDRLDAGAAQVVTRVVVDVEGRDEPACVAETVARVHFTT